MRSRIFLLLAIPLSALVACGVGRPAEQGSAACSGCHGNAENAAPPYAAMGGTATTDLGVGAHQAHLRDGAIRKAIACSECHVVPASVDSPGHIDSRISVTFATGEGDLAKGLYGGLAPKWDESTATCSSVYCHGASLDAGGKATAPVWTRADQSQAQCDSCHGNPPGGDHPQSGNCNLCHSETVNTGGTINVQGGKHIDGTVEGPHPEGWISSHGQQVEQQGTASCKVCHGADLSGGISGVACSKCHGG